jgi:hypothetical protein
MRILSSTRDAITIEFSKDELESINNSLNEVCNGIDVPEFSTRMGATKAEVLELLRRVSEALDAMVP